MPVSSRLRLRSRHPHAREVTIMLDWQEVLRLARQGNPPPDRRVEKSEDEWRRLLTPEQFQIARRKGTERSFTGEYCERHDPGLYACVCCGTPLFDSRVKFDSGTGWPSFTEPVASNVVKYEADHSYGCLLYTSPSPR